MPPTSAPSVHREGFFAHSLRKKTRKVRSQLAFTMEHPFTHSHSPESRPLEGRRSQQAVAGGRRALLLVFYRGAFFLIWLQRRPRALYQKLARPIRPPVARAGRRKTTRRTPSRPTALSGRFRSNPEPKIFQKKNRKRGGGVVEKGLY